MTDRLYDCLDTFEMRIAIAQNKLGVSQPNLSQAFGISLRTYQNNDLGKRTIPVAARADLNRRPDVYPNWILVDVEDVRLKHDLAAPEEFEVAQDKYLSGFGTELKTEQRRAIAVHWQRSVLEGKEIAMCDVHTWTELSRE